MDYSKTRNAKSAKSHPAYDDQNRKGPPKHKHGQTPDKAALLARMKATVAAKKQG